MHQRFGSRSEETTMNLVTNGLGGQCLLTGGYGCPSLAERPAVICQVTLWSPIKDEICIMSSVINGCIIESQVADTATIESEVVSEAIVTSPVHDEVTIISPIHDEIVLTSAICGDKKC